MGSCGNCSGSGTTTNQTASANGCQPCATQSSMPYCSELPGAGSDLPVGNYPAVNIEYLGGTGTILDGVTNVEQALRILEAGVASGAISATDLLTLLQGLPGLSDTANLTSMFLLGEDATQGLTTISPQQFFTALVAGEATPGELLGQLMGGLAAFDPTGGTLTSVLGTDSNGNQVTATPCDVVEQCHAAAPQNTDISQVPSITLFDANGDAVNVRHRVRESVVGTGLLVGVIGTIAPGSTETFDVAEVTITEDGLYGFDIQFAANTGFITATAAADPNNVVGGLVALNVNGRIYHLQQLRGTFGALRPLVANEPVMIFTQYRTMSQIPVSAGETATLQVIVSNSSTSLVAQVDTTGYNPPLVNARPEPNTYLSAY